MQKINKILFTFCFLSIIPLLGNELVLGPYLQDVHPTSITIMWQTESATVGLVRFGINTHLLLHATTEAEARTLHQVKLTNLHPAQTYYYQCNWPDGKTSQGSFRTAPNDAVTPLRIAVLGDSRSDLSMAQKIAELIMGRDPDIVLHTGDIVGNGNDQGQWKTYFFDPMKKLLPNIPIYPVLGNHEQESPFYYNFFPLNNRQPWWAENYGSVHIIGLDTNLPIGAGSEQYQFLVTELKKQEQPWTLVMFHHPLFHTHPWRPIQDFRYDLQPLFIRYGVDLVLTGHDHYYHRTFPIGHMGERQTGVVHITTAGGGATLYPTLARPYSAFTQSRYHFLLIDVTENELEIRAINADDQVFDAIIIDQDQEYSPAEFVEYGMYELERKLNLKLGGIIPSRVGNGTAYFDTTLSVATNFFLPVRGRYTWQLPAAWHMEENSQNLVVAAGEPFQLSFKGQVAREHFMPAPELVLHLEADNSNRNITDHRPYQHALGFRNQNLQLSLEKAAYQHALAASTDDLSPMLFMLDYYADSKYTAKIISELAVRIIKSRDPRILVSLKAFLQHTPSDLNKFRIYPFYFLFEDFSHLEEWIDILGRLPAGELSFAPQLFRQLKDLPVFNIRTVKGWQLIGPFPAVDGQGLATVFGPEVDFDWVKEYPDGTGQQLKWKTYRTDQNSVDLAKALTEPDVGISDVVAYAHTTVIARQAGKILLLLGSDDDPVVWVNQHEIFRKRIGRALHCCQDIMVVPVQAGENDLLIKVVQRGGGWGLDLRISDWKHILE